MWSAKVRERDGKCVLCGKAGKGVEFQGLQSRHIISRAEQGV
jgi:hypothetical protein